MRLYEGDIQKFKDDVINSKIQNYLINAFLQKLNRNPTEAEKRSWNNSMNFLRNLVDSDEFDKNMIILEYNLPYSSSRIDALLFGVDLFNELTTDLIELKQWSNDGVKDSDIEDAVQVLYSQGWKTHAHPSLQAKNYYEYLSDYIEAIYSHKLNLHGEVYCHNYSRFDKNNVLYFNKFERLLTEIPIYSKEDVKNFRELLLKRLAYASGEEPYRIFINSPIKPSKMLLKYVKDLILNRRIFNLIDDQLVPYQHINTLAKKQSESEEKHVIIIKGGPGTGKTAIALECMASLLDMGKTVYYATGSKAMTETLRGILKNYRGRGHFAYFYEFNDYKENEVDVIIADEAHRLRMNSQGRNIKFSKRSDKVQPYGIIKAAKLSVFLLDEDQVVRPNEVGTVDLIKDTAKELGIKEENIFEYQLETQFRCNGSDSYLLWLDYMLQIRDHGKYFLTNEDGMSFKIVDSIWKLKEIIDQKNIEKPNTARIVAPFLWPWSDPKEDGSLVNDVRIGDFSMPWENKKKFWEWATNEVGMNQVGTVYTSQGFEFEYIGVIFGNDLVYDANTGKLKAFPERLHDPSLKKKNLDVTKYIKNVYRVLLSRAHYGVFVYFMDNGTRKYFEDHLGHIRI